MLREPIWISSVRLYVLSQMRPLHGLQKDKFHLFFGGALQNAVIARHWDWRYREFTLVNDQAWMSIITQRVPYYAMVSILESCRAQLASVQELKKVRRTHDSECAYLLKCLRVLISVSTSYSLPWCCRRRAPTGRYFFIAQGGRKPWVRHWYPFIELCRSGTPTTATQTKRAR